MCVWAEQAVYRAYQLEEYAKPRPPGHGGYPFWMITAISLLAGTFMLKQATAEIDEHGLGQGWTMYITVAILSREPLLAPLPALNMQACFVCMPQSFLETSM